MSNINKKLHLIFIMVLLVLCAACSNNTTSSSSGDIMYDGTPIAQFLEMTRDDFIKEFGEYDGNHNAYSNDDKGISMAYFDDHSGKAEFVRFNTRFCTLNGSSLERGVNKITSVLAHPYTEGSNQWNDPCVSLEYPHFRIDFIIFDNTAIFMDIFAIDSEIATEQQAAITVPSQANHFASREILYKGVSVFSLFDYLFSDLSDIIGAPLEGEWAGEDSYFGFNYGDIIIYTYSNTGKITSVVATDPSAFSVDGVTLDENRAGIIEIFGEPAEEWDDRGYGLVYYFDNLEMYISMNSPDEKAYAITIKLSDIITSNDSEAVPGDDLSGMSLRVTADAGLRMRSGPGTNYDIIRVIDYKEIVIEIDDGGNASGWTSIYYEGDTGWANAEYLVPVGSNVDKDIMGNYQPPTSNDNQQASMKIDEHFEWVTEPVMRANNVGGGFYGGTYVEPMQMGKVIQGTVRNTTSKTFSSAQITFSLYDSSGNQIDSAVAYISSLGGGNTWKFEASVYNDSASNFKFEEIIAY